MKTITVISNVRDCVIELTHLDSDPGMWTVRHATRFLWFTKRLSSHWFNEEQQALAFANELKRDCDLRRAA
jgi:hypothetical protein